MAVLLLLAQQAGRPVPKETLIQGAWQGPAVTDNSLAQAIKVIRAKLGPRPDGAPYIETLAGQGYRFTVPVERELMLPSLVDDGLAGEGEGDLYARLEPHRAFVDGRAGLETVEPVS
jgi:hypothetical protein